MRRRFPASPVRYLVADLLDPPDGPWPLTRGEVESFAADGLELVRLEDFRDLEAHRWRAELRRGGAAQTRSRPT